MRKIKQIDDGEQTEDEHQEDAKALMPIEESLIEVDKSSGESPFIFKSWVDDDNGCVTYNYFIDWEPLSEERGEK